MYPTIRTRILGTALLPVVLVVIGLVGFFAHSRLGDISDAHQRWSKLFVNQLAQASEYAVFSGNAASLQHLGESALKEPGVRAVTIFNAEGKALSRTGLSVFASYEDVIRRGNAAQPFGTEVDTWVQSIESSTVELNDMFAAPNLASGQPPQVLGYVVLEISREQLTVREHQIMFVTLIVGLLGLFLGGFLAMRLGVAVMRPITRVSRRIRQIGEGDFAVDEAIKLNDPLFEVQVGLDRMATRLAWGRDELEQRVASVTDALRLKKDEAESATMAKSRFLSAASHDLRQPIHAIGLFIARLGQLPMDAQARKLVGNLEESVQAMQDLLDGLLDLSRLESGFVTISRNTVRVGHLFDTVRSALEPLAAAKGLRLRVRNSNACVSTDSVVLQRILMNLVHNAIRYTHHGSVLLTARPANQGRSVRIEVWDSGIGISPEHQSDIFREFYQVGNSGRDRARGLGLGLSIVERSARLLGHDLALRSNLGCGTRFSICVPIASTPIDTVDIQRDLGFDTLELAGLRVLVIEDDAMARDAIESLLVAWGCNVCAELGLAHAVNAVQVGFVPEVIVSDYRLGDGENGLSAITMLRNMVGKDVPACLMSGDTDGDLMQATREAGLILLHKPVRPAKLRAFLRRSVMPQ